MTRTSTGWAWSALAPPLDPTPEEGRSWLRRELADPDYQTSDLVGRLLRWLDRVLGDGVATVQGAPPLQLFATILVVLLLVLGAAWLLTRTGRGGRRRPPGTATVVDDLRLTAADLRARADAAYAEGRWGDALVDAFRAAATREAERGQVEDLPGRTVREVALALATAHPERAEEVSAVAHDFDAVLYGDRPGDRGRADAALALEDALRRPRARAR